MKTFLKLLFILACKPIYSQSINEIKQLMHKQEIAWNNGNIDAFMNYYWHSDSLKFIGSKGITYGWQKTLNNYKKNYSNKALMGQLKFEIIDYNELNSQTIFIIGKWDLNRDKPVGGYFTLLWKKINTQWFIVVDHTS
ncbi:MAG: DUF4440 domain-containing protein [Bacteroidetes bacterium]|nr:DUF4440 domain-containing protein [Bacteroidota bacterium]